MSVTNLATQPDGRVERLFNLLDRTDYRIISTDEDRDAVFQLRYESYLRENAIGPDFSRRLSDHYDDLENTTIFGVFLDGELTATIRASVGTNDYPEFPAMEVFGDLLSDELAAGKSFVDSTRFAIKEHASRTYPGLVPYIVARAPWMVAEYFQADYMLAGVRPEHRAFYARVMDFKLVSGPRFYPKLASPHFLMSCDYAASRETVQRRNPAFRSTFFERRMLMEHQTLAIAPRLDEIERIPTGAEQGLDGTSKAGAEVAEATAQ